MTWDGTDSGFSDNIVIGRYVGPDEWGPIANNIIYEDQAWGELDSSNLDLIGTGQADAIDEALFVSPIYEYRHGVTCEPGASCDWTPSADSLACGMASDGGDVGAIPCITD